MSKFAKFCLIAAAIMICLGLFIGTVVTAIGGRNVIHNIANDGIITVSPGGMKFWDWSWGWPWNYGNRGNWNIDLTVNGNKAQDRSYTAAFAANDIDSLNIKVGIGDFKVVPWDQDDFQIEIRGMGKLNYYSEAKTLVVDGFDLSSWNTVNVNASNNKLTLYVPQNISYDNIRAEVGVGALNIRDLTANYINTDSGVGSLTMNDMTVGRLNIENSVGETTFKGEVNGDITAECSIGSISLRLKGEYSDFDYAINCALGNISIAGRSYTSLVGESTISNDADKKMRLDCSIGNIDVKFY